MAKRMDRLQLLDCLNLTKAGLSTNDMLPVTTHYCFTGTELITYNGTIGFRIPLVTEFKGGIPGAVFRALIEHLHYREIEIKEVEGSLAIKAGREKWSAESDLPIMPPKAFLFDFPEPTGEVLPVKMLDLVDRIKAVLRSAHDDASAPERLGVTMLLRDGQLSCYATDDETLSHAWLPLPNDYQGPKHVVLPTTFCKELINLADQDSKLELQEKSAVLMFGKGKCLFGRFIVVDHRMDFEGMFDAHYSDRISEKMIDMPERLHSIIDRAVIITEGPSQDAIALMRETAKSGISKTRLSVFDGKALFVSESSRGRIVDRTEAKQSDCAPVKINPKRLRVFEHYKRFLATEDAILMANDNSVFMVSTSPAKLEEEESRSNKRKREPSRRRPRNM